MARFPPFGPDVGIAVSRAAGRQSKRHVAELDSCEGGGVESGIAVIADGAGFETERYVIDDAVAEPGIGIEAVEC